MKKTLFWLFSVLAVTALLLGACMTQGSQPQFLLAPKINGFVFEQPFEAIETPVLEFDAAKPVPPKPPMKITPKCDSAWEAWGNYTGGTMKKKWSDMTREGHRLYSLLVTFCFYQGGNTESSEYIISKR